MRRVERDPEGGWIARDARGREIPEPNFRWNSRSVARAVAWEADEIDKFYERNFGLPPQAQEQGK